MPIQPNSFRFQLDEATGVGTIRFNRPDVLNALTFEVYRELREAFDQLHAEPSVRALLLTGEGRAFCTGGDVEQIIGALFDRDYGGLLEFTRLTGALIKAIRRCGKPVVAGLNGTVAGAGAVIASACDVRVAAESARIAFLFTKVGLSGADMGAAWLLPRIVGLAKASELLLLGDFIGAAEAERIGLYNQVVPDAELPDAARQWAERLARGPRLGMALTKELLTRELHMDLDTALELDSQAQAACMQHPDFREAYEAFRAKRKPTFQ
jgi:enoyl-CoA hydratase/carnithine racemase